MSSRDNLKKGRFYWILIQPLIKNDRDISIDYTRQPYWQPGYFVGHAGDADARTVWEVLGEAREEYHHRIDVIDFGPEIVVPDRGCF